MTILPLSDRFGNQLVSIRFPAEAGREVLDDPAITPLSLVVVIYADEALMVLDRGRGQWELPGGMRERDESARQAAQRELAEETGISRADLGFAAVAEFSLAQPPRQEFAAVYHTVLAAVPELLINDEVLGFRWWNAGSPVLSDMSPLDAEIGRRPASRPVW
jgi:8-oxo-dGTP diphosphatase